MKKNKSCACPPSPFTASFLQASQSCGRVQTRAWHFHRRVLGRKVESRHETVIYHPPIAVRVNTADFAYCSIPYRRSGGGRREHNHEEIGVSDPLPSSFSHGYRRIGPRPTTPVACIPPWQSGRWEVADAECQIQSAFPGTLQMSSTQACRLPVNPAHPRHPPLVARREMCSPSTVACSTFVPFSTLLRLRMPCR